MIRKLFLAVVTLIATMGFAFAQVDVNKGDKAALDGIKGIGPKMSKTIIDERKKGGDFKDWADFEKRVKGVGDKSSAKLSAAGLTVNGQAKVGAAASADKKPATASVSAKDAAKPKDMKASMPAAAPAATPATPVTPATPAASVPVKK